MQYHWKLLKLPLEYTKTFILLTAHTKQQLLWPQIWQKIFCSIVSGWYKELKVKEFCVFHFIELLFLQKTRLKHTCLESLFVVSLTELLSFYVFDYYRKIFKRKQPWTKNWDPYLACIFKRWKNESSNKNYAKTNLI